MADYDAYKLKRDSHKRNPKPIDQRGIKRLRERHYYDGYFLELLKLKRPTSHYPASDGTPTWWEKKAHKQYFCSFCRKMISKGERYIGRRKLSPGRRGKYGYRGSYKTDYYHIVCLLEVAHMKAGKEIENASTEISVLRNQIASFKNIESQKKNQIEYCETAKQRTKNEYEHSNSWRRLVKWVSYKYTTWSKNREIRGLERDISHIENKEIPMRETHINELRRKISDLTSWQIELKNESAEFQKT